MSINENYIGAAPSPQTAVDLFANSWSSMLPDGAAVSGGRHRLFEDGRISWMIEKLGSIEGWDVLELGPLEAGHTTMLHKAGAAAITAIEAHSIAFLKCLVVKEILKLDRAHFMLGDFDKFLATGNKRFDLIVACGVLYHLTDPLQTLQHMMRLSDRIFIWSHFFDDAAMPIGDPRRAPFIEETQKREIGEDSLTYNLRSYGGPVTDPAFCGGIHEGSVWLDRNETTRMFEQHGYVVSSAFEHDAHPNGPCSCLMAVRTPSRSEVVTAAVAGAPPQQPTSPDQRLAFMRSLIDKSEPGLEISPSFNPVASKALGYNIKSIDSLDQADLRARYAGNPSVNPDSIEVVDYVGDGAYKDMIGAGAQFNYVVASHVIQRLADPVAFIKDLQTLITPDGRIILACPDHRYCFNHFRPFSGLGAVIDHHIESRNGHSVGTTAEFYLNFAARGGHAVWMKGAPGEYSLLYGRDAAIVAGARGLEAKESDDVHAWCFTPSSFHLLIEDLRALGYIDVFVDYLSGTVGCEFFAVLKKAPPGLPQVDRMTILKALQSEILEGVQDHLPG